MLTTLLPFAVIAICAAGEEIIDKKNLQSAAEEVRSKAIFKNTHGEVLYF